ncbi:uncharacterized protein LOC141855265 [Brevipalpus obovatus]|uniref:uncharacterized protein LOC141855265 n=1 Tax=Brevipalpus obovatus TaxID=246614 RepID=UPI003D9E6D00
MIKFIFISIFCASFLAISIYGQERDLFDDEEERNDLGFDLKGYFDMSSMMKSVALSVAQVLDKISPELKNSLADAVSQAQKARQNATLNMKSLNGTTNSTVIRPE